MSDAVDALMQEGGGGTPWAKFPAVGSVVRGTIVSIEQRQRTEFETNEPLLNKDNTPAMEIVVVLQTTERDPEIEDDTGLRALHAPVWFFEGCMRLAIMAAVLAAGAKAPEIGGELAVQHSGMDGKAKLYVATYAPPALTALTPPAEPIAATPAVAAPVAAPIV